MMKNRRSFIVGLKSIKLTSKEVLFLKKYKPWGVILFERNIVNIKQTRRLTNRIRDIFKDKNYPILVDQEGGRVSRFKSIIDTKLFTGEFFGKLYEQDIKKFNIYCEIFIKSISHLLNMAGININTIPLLDVRRRRTNNIIGDRSFSSNPKIVSLVGDYFINKFHSFNIATVMKHIPGHGLSLLDSHLKTPKINESIKKLDVFDFYPFKKKNCFFAMTAHIIYTDIDNKNTATHSKNVIKLIRDKIKFKNILISDDISMKSLKFSITENTKKAFKAGCNIVLHCNGNYEEMLKVAENSPKVSDFIIKKTSQFYKILS